MSMHKTPLSKMEEEGLLKHGLQVGAPSQLSDTFRQGIAWALQDPYIKSLIEDDQQAGITQAEEMNENMRLYGTIDKPANVAMPDFIKLSPSMREAGERAERDARRDGCCSVPVLQKAWFEAAIQQWIDEQQEIVELAALRPVSGENVDGDKNHE